MKRQYIIIFIAMLLLVAIAPDLFAQGCSQCRMVPGSDINAGNGIGKGLNNGILYLLVIPYVFLGVIAFIYRKKLREFFQRMKTRNY